MRNIGDTEDINNLMYDEIGLHRSWSNGLTNLVEQSHHYQRGAIKVPIRIDHRTHELITCSGVESDLKPKLLEAPGYHVNNTASTLMEETSEVLEY